MRKRIIVSLSLLALLGATSLLTACNTVAGAGQDVSATGNAVSRGAEKLKP